MAIQDGVVLTEEPPISVETCIHIQQRPSPYEGASARTTRLLLSSDTIKSLTVRTLHKKGRASSQK